MFCYLSNIDILIQESWAPFFLVCFKMKRSKVYVFDFVETMLLIFISFLFIEKSNSSSCGGELSGLSGKLQSPSSHTITANDCTWVIKVPEHRRIRLKFDSIHMVSNKIQTVLKINDGQI